MDHINFSFTVDTLLLVIVFNVVLTALHFVLYWIYQKKKWQWSDWALNVVNFLMTMVSIIIANRPHPDNKNEAAPK